MQYRHAVTTDDSHWAEQAIESESVNNISICSFPWDEKNLCVWWLIFRRRLQAYMSVLRIMLMMMVMSPPMRIFLPIKISRSSNVSEWIPEVKCMKKRSEIVYDSLCKTPRICKFRFKTCTRPGVWTFAANLRFKNTQTRWVKLGTFCCSAFLLCWRSGSLGLFWPL